MIEFYISLGVLAGLYLVSGIFLYVRSNTPIISARSSLLLYIFHVGNFIETGSILIIIYSSVLNFDREENEESCILVLIAGVSHFLIYFTYILRSYRLYLVFNIEELDDYINSKYFERTKQKWLAKVSILMILPAFTVYGLLSLLVYTSSVKNLYSTIEPNLNDSSAYVMILMFTRFCEHLVMIVTIYMIRKVTNDFKMSIELSFATLIYSLTPFMSLFVSIKSSFYWIYIVRNVFLMLLTSVAPVILSYTQSVNYQLLTVDMLNSFELILLHPKCLEAFEKFLKEYKSLSLAENENQGLIYLNILLAIECWNESKDPSLKDFILNLLKNCEKIAPPDGETDCEEYFENVRFSTMKLLKSMYFKAFNNSVYMDRLQKEAYRHELYQIKINYTSLIGSREKINYFDGDWPTEG